MKPTQQTISTRGIKPLSLFKIILIGYTCSLGPLLILSSIIFPLLGFSLESGGKEYTGFMAMFMQAISAPIAILFLSIVSWVFIVIGLSIYTHFKSLSINFKTSYDSPENMKKGDKTDNNSNLGD